MTSELMVHVMHSGFAELDSLVHLFVGGSELHGAKVGSTDDLDIYGIFIETPQQVMGLHSRDHFVWSTAGDERRNGPEDVDVTLYSLRKWSRLAARGESYSNDRGCFFRSDRPYSFLALRVTRCEGLLVRRGAAAKDIGRNTCALTAMTQRPRCIVCGCISNALSSWRAAELLCLDQSIIC